MGSCRHNLGAHNSVHFIMVWVAHMSRIICAHKMAPLPVSHRCAHRLRTFATKHRAFTMGVNRPWPSLFSHLKIYSKHAALKELVFILCSVNPTAKFDTCWERISESTLNFVYLSQAPQYSHKQLVRLRGKYLLGWYCQNFILWACANHSQFKALLQK